MGFPDKRGYFGEFGGRFVPETLMFALEQLEKAYNEARRDPIFRRALGNSLRDFGGRPTPLYLAKALTERWEGPRIYLKREDLNHTGAHKINNCLGQAILARRMGKMRLIAETGAGQHGTAVATVAARYGMQAVIYMGAVDAERQAPNVDRMRLLGAEVIRVSSGTATLKDATNEALRDWAGSVENTHYIIGSTVGPHPFPKIVRDFQSVIGLEARKQIIEKERRLPDLLVACVGGGSNSIGLFHPFVKDRSVEMLGIESAGDGIETPRHAATLAKGRPGVLHGSFSTLLQDQFGQILPTHTFSAGLDYPGVGPEHSHLNQTRRASYSSATDAEALDAFVELCRYEGIIPALESSFALAGAKRAASAMKSDQIIIVNLSGRGDKDLATVFGMLNEESFHREQIGATR